MLCWQRRHIEVSHGGGGRDLHDWGGRTNSSHQTFLSTDLPNSLLSAKSSVLCSTCGKSEQILGFYKKGCLLLFLLLLFFCAVLYDFHLMCNSYTKAGINFKQFCRRISFFRPLFHPECKEESPAFRLSHLWGNFGYIFHVLGKFG